jgi:hypothetical protein
MKLVPPSPKISKSVAARGFMTAALILCTGSAITAAASFFEGDSAHGLLLSAVAIFAGWMAAAIYQFQHRLEGIDEVVRQARRRVEQSDAVLAEMQQLARRLRAASQHDENEGDRTLH